MPKNLKLWKEVDAVHDIYLGKTTLAYILKEEIRRLEDYSKNLKSRTSNLADDYARESRTAKADFNRLGNELGPVIEHAKIILKKYRYEEAKAKEKYRAMADRYYRETGERWDY